MHSMMSSSLVETSEDEEAKRKEKERSKTDKKKEDIERELAMDVDIEICETETQNFLYIPSCMVTLDSEEYNAVENANKKYDQLL